MISFPPSYLPKGANEKKEASLVMHKMTLPKAVREEIKFSKVFSQGNVYSWVNAQALAPASQYVPDVWKNVEKKLILTVKEGDEFDEGEVATMDLVVVFIFCNDIFCNDHTRGFPLGEEGKLIQNILTTSEEYTIIYKLLKSIDASKYPDFAFGWDSKKQSDYMGDQASKEGKKIVIHADGKKYWKKVDAFEKADVEKYLKDWIAGKIKPSYKSAELKDEYEKNVRILTGNNFDEIALSPKLDVLVKFYAPWCGHCKALVPVWDELADKIKDMGYSDKVVIAKFDATENECEIAIEGYPRLMFFPAVKNSVKKKQEYQSGERTVGKFIEFLGEHSKSMEDLDIPGEKIDKKSFSMVDREMNKKKKGGKEEL